MNCIIHGFQLLLKVNNAELLHLPLVYKHEVLVEYC